MNAQQPRTAPSYGYDSADASFPGTGTPIFGYGVAPNRFTALNLKAFAGNVARSGQFTGKERDSESGLDYFGARYYGSALGRFTTADWSATPAPVPYADFSNPQTLNQYTYVLNNPLGHPDADGHCCEDATNFGEQLVAAPNPYLKAAGYVVIGAAALGTAMTNPEFRKTAGDIMANAGGGGGQYGDFSKQLKVSDLYAQSSQTPTRGQALNDAKNDAGVPTSQQPQKQETVPLTDPSGKPIVVDGQKQNTREYTHTTGSGDTVVIQDHGQGHSFPDGGQVGPHFNVGPADNTRNGTVPGTQPHYTYKKPGEQE